MGRTPCCSKVGLHRGPWSAKEDTLLITYIREHGEGQGRSLPQKAGLLRCGKSCRLRWMNYLRPEIKRGNITPDEDDLIIRLHSLLGSRWSLIARRLPGRTDNEIKNYWNSHLSKKGLQESTSVTETKTSKVLQKKRSCSQSNSTNAKNNKINSANHKELPTKTKIYLPNAIRVSPYSITIENSSFDSCRVGGSSSSGDGDGVGNVGSANDAEVLALNTPAPFRPNNVDHKIKPVAWNEEYNNNLTNEFDIPFLGSVPTEENMIDEIF